VGPTFKNLHINQRGGGVWGGVVVKALRY
jgi:hypothetical protein